MTALLIIAVGFAIAAVLVPGRRASRRFALLCLLTVATRFLWIITPAAG